jgi:hypothetical protein
LTVPVCIARLDFSMRRACRPRRDNIFNPELTVGKCDSVFSHAC